VSVLAVSETMVETSAGPIGPRASCQTGRKNIYFATHSRKVNGLAILCIADASFSTHANVMINPYHIRARRQSSCYI
jgi:hypothetical protein